MLTFPRDFQAETDRTYLTGGTIMEYSDIQDMHEPLPENMAESENEYLLGSA
jgi:hypothetical protein